MRAKRAARASPAPAAGSAAVVRGELGKEAGERRREFATAKERWGSCRPETLGQPWGSRVLPMSPERFLPMMRENRRQVAWIFKDSCQ